MARRPLALPPRRPDSETSLTFRFWSAALSASISSSPHAAVGPAAFPGACGGRPARGVGGFLIAEALLSFAPVAVLGSAIGWPASLRKPAAGQLAAIAAAPDAVALGDGLYLLYSVLVAPVMIVLAARAFGGLQRLAVAAVAAFGERVVAVDARRRSVGDALRAPAPAPRRWSRGAAVNPPVNMLFSAPCACAPRQPPRRGRRA